MADILHLFELETHSSATSALRPKRLDAAAQGFGKRLGAIPTCRSCSSPIQTLKPVRANPKETDALPNEAQA
jgi:hypothetical protein